MAYTFPPRGFSQQENSQQIPDYSGRPPFPPCPPSRHLFHGTPMGNPTGHDIPSIGRENMQFRPRPSPFMRFPNPRAFGPPSHQGQGAWTGSAGPQRQFDPRICQVRPYRPRTQYNQFSPAFTSDITAYESWPASSCRPGRDGQQQGGQGDPSHPRTGQRSMTNQQNISKGVEFSNQKKHKNRKVKKRGPCSQKGQGNVAAQGLCSDDTPHYCDVCDRGFNSQELLDDHLKQHTKCSHPGCRFEAHFKVVKNHIKMQHGPGSKKVAWLETSEEISRWREERKRNFPSTANIAKKEEMSRSNQEQGVTLQNKYFGKMRQHKQGKHQLKGQTRDHGVDTKRRRINMTTQHDSIASGKVKHQVETASAELTHGSLAALAVAYDESEDEVTKLQQVTQVIAVEGHRQDASTSRTTNSQVRFQNQYRQKNKGKNKKANRSTRAGKERQRRQEELRRRPNLLEMLLAPDIRRERNTILQCVRYVVQNDFFEIGEPNTTQTTESEGIFSKPCPNVTETTGTRQETQVCVLTPERAGNQTSSDSKLVMTMEEKSLVSQDPRKSCWN